MIATASRAETPATTSDWKAEWRASVTDAATLIEALGLSEADVARLGLDCSPDFPLRVPRAYLAKIRRGNPDDPLLLQVLARQLERQPGGVDDPTGDGAARVGPGLLHKYQGRVLLVSTGACAIHCRYCFRRHYPYAEDHASSGQWSLAVAAIAADPSIREVILSGGDPLSLDTPKLAALTAQLARLPQLSRFRLHTRLPAVLPARVDAALIHWLEALPWRTRVVLHINHAREIGPDVAEAVAKLRAAGADVLNQSVLLKGVNDSVDALVELSEALDTARILPYYLHQLDPVQGAGHFDVADATARALHTAMQARLPGYLVPRLVREIPGQPGKTWLG
ncbi:MAG: EF-P beta-lysylation protein EpmB [Xanthomonadales bacterium]|jgi:EF-P beta-lysylation protein EpmB|nr:EF-P beta-lysylation protein EpmB [Xanthomonadales bacterium]